MSISHAQRAASRQSPKSRQSSAAHPNSARSTMFDMGWQQPLECVSKREIRKFEWIFRQFKEEIRRLSSAKSRIDDAEMAERRPKLRTPEFLRHTLIVTKPSRRAESRTSSYIIVKDLILIPCFHIIKIATRKLTHSDFRVAIQNMPYHFRLQP